MSQTEFYPKGSMCANCKKAKDDCSKLNFSDMKVYQFFHGENKASVICNQFKKVNK